MKWTKNSVAREAKKYRTVSQFFRHNRKAYSAAYNLGIYKNVTKHMTRKTLSGKNNPRFKWTLNKIKKEASKYFIRSDFCKKSKGAYAAALKMGILDRVCVHMPKNASIGRIPNNKKWNRDSLTKEAKKYKTRSKFWKFSGAACFVATKMGILNEICVHMPKNKSILFGENNPFFKWTDEMLMLEGSKYKTRSDFYKFSSSAYVISARRGFLDKVCNHMKYSGITSSSERDIMAEIKKTYPDAKLFRDRKVKIKNKPHIKGFDIDIFIPSLHKGIEFDGTYYHSFEYMRASENKILWSNKDIKNYHKIKDLYFKSKGIDILHIKEENWINDKKKCLQKIFDFLKVTNGP